MIHRKREEESCPPSLDLKDPQSAGAKELAKVWEWIAGAEGRSARDPAQRPDFKAYKGADVKTALEALFEGKCAYCESAYGVLHPVEIEHWRPKAEVEVAAHGPPQGGASATRKVQGYEWLAMRWENLLPSCIDCNRARYQWVPGDGVEWVQVKMGKGNQFPLLDETKRWTDHLAERHEEEPALLDPCVDDPGRYFEFRGDGILLPKAGLGEREAARAVASIRVYALNRKGLVDERHRQLLWMELDFSMVRFLYALSGDERVEEHYRKGAGTLVEQALDRLRERMGAGVPYSQFAGQRLREFLERDLGAGD
jgi:hypothetical protein